MGVPIKVQTVTEPKFSAEELKKPRIVKTKKEKAETTTKKRWSMFASKQVRLT